MTLFTIMKTTPNLQATIRCIPFNIRTTAVSLQVYAFNCHVLYVLTCNTHLCSMRPSADKILQRLVFTLLGTIPGRILTGGIIDKACISWSTECGSLGACRAYDTVQVSKYMTYLICAQMVSNINWPVNTSYTIILTYYYCCVLRCIYRSPHILISGTVLDITNPYAVSLQTVKQRRNREWIQRELDLPLIRTTRCDRKAHQWLRKAMPDQVEKFR